MIELCSVDRDVGCDWSWEGSSADLVLTGSVLCSLMPNYGWKFMPRADPLGI